MPQLQGTYQPNQPKRRASTGSLPALGRKLSNGSLKAVKWIGKQLKGNKNSDKDKDDSDPEELWGTSREIFADLSEPEYQMTSVPSGYVSSSTLVQRAGQRTVEKRTTATGSGSLPSSPVTDRVRQRIADKKNTTITSSRLKAVEKESTSAFPDEYTPLSTLTHRTRREALEKHWHSDASLTIDSSLFPKQLDQRLPSPIHRPLTVGAQDARRKQYQQLGKAPHRTPHKPTGSLDRSTSNRPQLDRHLRLRSMDRDDLVARLPQPGPPPNSPLPDVPKSSKMSSLYHLSPGSSASLPRSYISTPHRRADTDLLRNLYK